MGRPDVGRMHAKKSLHFFGKLTYQQPKKFTYNIKLLLCIKERKIHAKIQIHGFNSVSYRLCIQSESENFLGTIQNSRTKIYNLSSLSRIYIRQRYTWGGYVFFSDKKLEVFGCSYSTSSECGARLVKDKLHILRKSPIISVKLAAEL